MTLIVPPPKYVDAFQTAILLFIVWIASGIVEEAFQTEIESRGIENSCGDED